METIEFNSLIDMLEGNKEDQTLAYGIISNLSLKEIRWLKIKLVERQLYEYVANLRALERSKMSL